jgi:chemotaxis protein MotB
VKRRSHLDQEPDRQDRWLVSYADFITLMFALFVVMYSVSSVNAGKYRVLSDTLGAVFAEATGTPPRAPGELLPAIEATGNRPIAIVAPGTPTQTLIALESASLEPAVPVDAPAGDNATGVARALDLAGIADRVQGRLQTSIAPEHAKVRKVLGRIEIEFDSAVLFDVGSARIAEAALPAVAAVAEELRATRAPIRVEGFTDDRPIASTQFPSNWELSAARAASLVHLFSEMKIDPARMAATGYGQYQPIADNGTPEGRSRNRRVVVVVGGAQVPAAGAGEGQAEAEGTLQRIDEFPQPEGPEL